MLECEWYRGGLDPRSGRKRPSAGQVVRRAFVHRSWNGVSVHGPNTLEHSKLWGFPNHTLGGSGRGGVIRHNVFLNGQDSIYFERNDFDDLTVEHNVLVNGVLFLGQQQWRRRHSAERVALPL